MQEIRPPNYTKLNADKLLKGKIQSIGHQEWVTYKPRWGAFYKTNVEHFFNERGINTLVFTGCNFPNCPRTYMYEASERDFRVVMACDAISQVYDRGTEEMENIGVNGLTVGEVLAEV